MLLEGRNITVKKSILLVSVEGGLVSDTQFTITTVSCRLTLRHLPVAHSYSTVEDPPMH